MDFTTIFGRHLFTLFFLFLICKEFSLEGHAENPIYYPRYADEVTGEFIQKVRKNYSLECYGTGGSMPTDIRSVSVNFLSKKCATIDEGREIIINLMKDFKSIIDSHEKIRPYLREYPFPIDRIDVSVHFQPSSKRKNSYSENHVEYLSCIKGNLNYNRTDPETKRYFKVKKEPYETALNIVRNSGK